MSLASGSTGSLSRTLPPRIAVYLTAGMICFAFAPILVRTAGPVDAMAFAAVRTTAAALILLPFWIFRQKRPVAMFETRDNMVAGLAGMMLGLHLIFWILAVQNTSIASASVLVTIHPVLLILIEAGFFKRVFPPLVWMGVFFAFSGSVLLGYSDARAGNEFEHALLGDLYALFAALLFVFYFLISQSLRQKSDWLNYVCRVYGATAITCLLIAIVAGSDFQLSPAAWLSALGLAIGAQLIGHGSMNYSVKYVSATMLSTLILSEPAFATLLAWWIFSEIPPGLTLVAMTVILSGIIMAWSTRTRKI